MKKIFLFGSMMAAFCIIYLLKAGSPTKVGLSSDLESSTAENLQRVHQGESAQRDQKDRRGQERDVAATNPSSQYSLSNSTSAIERAAREPNNVVGLSQADVKKVLKEDGFTAKELLGAIERKLKQTPKFEVFQRVGLVGSMIELAVYLRDSDRESLAGIENQLVEVVSSEIQMPAFVQVPTTESATYKNASELLHNHGYRMNGMYLEANTWRSKYMSAGVLFEMDTPKGRQALSDLVADPKVDANLREALKMKLASMTQ